MATNISNRWKKISPKCYGDFESKKSGPCYGYIEGDYAFEFGEFTADKKPNGLNIKSWGTDVRFFKYVDGKLTYPYTEISNIGTVELTLSNKDELMTKLSINLKDSSFELFRCDVELDKTGYAVFYDCQSSTFEFRKYECSDVVESVKVPKKFTIANPIITNEKISMPRRLDFSDIQIHDEEKDFCQIYFTPKDGNGIGMNTWKNGKNEILHLKDGEPNGYLMYQFDSRYEIFYSVDNKACGLSIEVYDDGETYVYISKPEGDKTTSSAIIKINGEKVVLADSSTGSIEDSDRCARIRYLSELSFSVGDNSDYSDYYYAKSMLEEERILKKGGVIFGLDDTDPEYKMMNLVGQEDAKKEFKRIKAYVQKNDARHIYKNIVFCGEDGVGKSTVARLISELLHKYGAIQNTDYVEKSGKELFDNSTGATTRNLDLLYDEGEGGVILIDDFHYLEGLNASNVKEGLIALSRIMKNDSTTVFILCDNKYNMNQILENNKDLFQDIIRFKVDFRDFTREELEQILRTKIKELFYSIEKDAMEKLLDIIFLSKSYGNNINARAALSILEEIIVIQNVRTELVDDKTITIDDIDVYVSENDIAFIDQKTGYQSEARKKLDELVGLEKIKETVDDLIAYFSINRGKRVDFHMSFTGNPGTGKTEVARIIGKLLRQEGILGTSKFIEVTRRDLVGQYIGQSAIITRDIIDKAMGGVLYIDEAYSLAYGGERDFGPEVIAELLKAMEDRRGEFCVVLAGYTSEMKKLFDLNPGFKSRIKFELEFPDYTDEELEKIAHLFLKREGYTMSDEDVKILVRIVSMQRNYPNFANVRTLRESLSRLQIRHAGKMRQIGGDINSKELGYDDIVNTFSKEEIDKANSLLLVKPSVPKLDPKVLLDLQKDYKEIPFSESKEILSEAILALQMDSSGRVGEGSGFMITKDGYFITCAHCVDKVEKIIARRRINHHNHYVDIKYDAKVVSIDTKADIALCKIESDGKEEFDCLVLANKDNEILKLDGVYLMGYPFGVSRFDEMSINFGKVASYQKENNNMLAQINLDIQAKGGNSGSPIIDEKTSKVIGVLCGSAISNGAQITEEINYARPIDYVWKLLENEFKENK